MSPARATAQHEVSTDRIAAAHAGEVRAIQALCVVVLLVVGSGWALVVRPWVHLKAAMPALDTAAAAAEGEATRLQRAREAVREAIQVLSTLRRRASAGPAQLRREIARLVEQGRALDPDQPYRAVIQISPATTGGGPAGGERVTVEEAVRRQIGRHVEEAGLAVENALAPVLSHPDLPAPLRVLLEDLQATIGRETVRLHEVMQQVFAQNPDFWQQWGHEPLPYAGASPEAGEVARRIDAAVQSAQGRLAAMGSALQAREREQRDRAEGLRGRRQETARRLAALRDGSGWAPLGIDDAVRLYPLLAGVLTLTLYYRLRRALAVRRGLAAFRPDWFAPSWLLVEPGTPGRWWALVLLAAPLAATVYAAAVLLADRAVFATALGEWSLTTTAAYAVLYVVLSLLGAVEWVRLATGERTKAASAQQPAVPAPAPRHADRGQA